MSGALGRRAASRKTGESAYFNLHTLRRLYNTDNSGRGIEGIKGRYDLHSTITHISYLLLSRAVPIGRGCYGSSVVELALRVLMVIVYRGMSVHKIAEELSLAVLDRASLVQNLQALAIAIQKYSLRENIVEPQQSSE
jgi:hypothetical protein